MRYTVYAKHEGPGAVYFVYDRRADRYVAMPNRMRAIKASNRRNLDAAKGLAPGLKGKAKRAR